MAAVDANSRSLTTVNFIANFRIALLLLLIGVAAMLGLGTQASSLHTILDTAVVWTAALIALLYWDISRRTGQTAALLLSISFAVLVGGELIHTLAVLGRERMVMDLSMSAATWTMPSYVLPTGILASLMLGLRRRSIVWLFAPAMVLFALTVATLALIISRIGEPALFGITRSSLILVPILWAAVAIRFWRSQSISTNAMAFTAPAVIFLLAYLVILTSHSPGDTSSVIAHYGKLVAEALLLFNMIQIGAADTARRQQVEQELKELNRELDMRVVERTAQLRETEERAGLIVDAALDAVISINDAGAITVWNPQAEKTFGWTPHEALGRSVDQIIMPERFREAHRLGMVRYLATEEGKVLNRRLEMVAIHRDGHEFPVELTITPIRAGGAVSFSAFVRDITERKLAETKLQAQIERLRLLEQITRAIGQRQDVHSIYQIAVRTLEDQLPADFVCICRFDRATQKLSVAHVGVGSATLGVQLGIGDRAEIPIDRNGLSRCVAGELVYEPDISEVGFPFPSRLAAQGLRSLVVAPLMLEEAVFGVLVVARSRDHAFPSTDCEFLRQLGEHVALATHQADLRDSLQRAYEDLQRSQQAVLEQERLRAIGQMASGIAHDINNAISPIALYTKALLERGPHMADEVRSYVELVGRVTKDVAATVARLRDFYRRSDEGAELSHLNLNELVPQMVELTRARWSDMPQQQGVVVKVSTDLEADLPFVMGNASELREAMTNLIFNAVDAMPEGGTITIRTKAITAGSHDRPHVRLEVADTGVGMDEETRLRCLDPFFTTKGERGTGLGLAMVYGTAQRHNAALDIESKLGEGTSMALVFASASAPVPKRVKVPREQKPLRLLLADDDPAVLRSTAFVLKRDGHVVTTADGGQAALDAMKSAVAAGQAFDAVITDLGMPYVDGNQVARAVKELLPSTPVVLLTGWGRRMANGEEAPAYVDFMLPKPLELDELRAIFAGLG